MQYLGNEKGALSRRSFVGKLATGAAGAAVALAAGAKGAEALVPPKRSEERVEAEERFGAEDRQPERAVSIGEGERHGAEETEVGAAASAPPESVVVEPQTPPPWELLEPLAVGSVVGHGWRVADLSSVVDGSCVLTLGNHSGRTHRIHVCRNDGRPQGLVYTKRLDLVVMNGGRGDLPTEEGFAQAVAEVGHVLAANENRARHGAVVTALLPQAERERRYSGAAKLR